eukprot:4078953-Heterocapsa_arctica.AAC.1
MHIYMFTVHILLGPRFALFFVAEPRQEETVEEAPAVLRRRYRGPAFRPPRSRLEAPGRDGQRKAVLT